MDPAEFIFCFVLVIFLIGFVQWKRSGNKKMFRIAESNEVFRKDSTSLSLGDQAYAGNINYQLYHTVINPDVNANHQFNSNKLDD